MLHIHNNSGPVLLVEPKNIGLLEDGSVAPKRGMVREIDAAVILAAAQAGLMVSVVTDKKVASSNLVRDGVYHYSTVLGTKSNLSNYDTCVTESTDVPKPRAYNNVRDIDTLPVFLSVGDCQRGVGKYLLHSNTQLQTLRELSRCKNIREPFRFQEFIPCPSERYTSFRLLVSATGSILAAGLLYSTRKKSEAAVLDNTSKLRFDPSRSQAHDLLENPRSKYYLQATNALSNVSAGGNIIPLMGSGITRVFTAEEQKILVAHGIAPRDPCIPERLREHTLAINKFLSKRAGIVVGIDFIQHEKSKEYYYLESNPGPGTKTYIACWPETVAQLTAGIGRRFPGRLFITKGRREELQTHREYKVLMQAALSEITRQLSPT